ncbi:uncharacterized protein KY384_003118 [Bacidia gigantensis]|uniref:uncharacterized protein n=1 Tax=Bacidia gigantensis TaxID=2732470 RepID=UPI001D05A78C|nr:uncharacterized protein KY384_003118 [Bacidia gigantensis]KAG8531489.1 hypothetical protein KY384_003118 [Bacidia gigantensis]
MQSGISVSKELQDAFQELVSSPAQRGIVAIIKSEAITPLHVLPASSPDFLSDLSSLRTLLSDNQAAYILLRRYENAPDGYVAITYVPDAAPVRQKMLHASTRLSLVRELGAERFRETLFATELRDLEKDGWERHDASGALKAPLSEEEETLKGVRDAEAEARGGTEGRRLETGGKLSMAISGDARSALENLKEETSGKLVQLSIDPRTESIELVSVGDVDASSLAPAISDTESRYSLFRYSYTSGGTNVLPLIFISSCPSNLKVRDRMLHASSKAGFLSAVNKDVGLAIARKFEVTSPTEISQSTIEDEFTPKQEQKQGFLRPKKPGKR